MIDLLPQDKKQLADRGMSESDVREQCRCLNEVDHAVRVLRPAISGDGILTLSESAMQRLQTAYDRLSQGKRLMKFVPASGAASRMFKKWFQWLEEMPEEGVETLSKTLHDYPFYQMLDEMMREQGISLNALEAAKDYRSILQFLLTPEGLRLGSLPKGLLPFHRTPDGVRTAFEEHWVEAAAYAACSDGCVHLHFTVSPEHENGFRRLAQALKLRYGRQTGLRYELEFSHQMPQTDTVSLDSEGNLFRDPEGGLVFRPGGHGSLIHNLNHLDADVVFIKNIDNVTTDALRADTIVFKKCLAAMLLECQAECFAVLRRLDDGTDTDALEAAEGLMRDTLHLPFPSDYAAFDTARRREYCRMRLDRPIRVCGMVPREKDPGGGPFWVQGVDGLPTLQIVETSELDLGDPGQRRCLDDSRFFNPVDLVCGLKDYRGRPFDLTRYVDRNRYFTAEKSQAGRSLRVLEHPGLWNGAMSDWITIFVAVPITTFTPVKTVEDLLRPAHLSTSNTR